MDHSLTFQLKALLRPDLCLDPAIYRRFVERSQQGRLTRDENRLSHLCVYFAAYDPAAGQVFLGHHKKSGLWLFTGGHVDPGESLQEGVSREIWEEWGREIEPQEAGEPGLLTITTILQADYPCREHYDLWYFFPVEKETFHVDQDRLAEEFHQIWWMTVEEARGRTTDPNNLQTLGVLERRFLTR
jgi:8-oxo-dGTP pyrophosphatase MutT (NUDIX family)